MFTMLQLCCIIKKTSARRHPVFIGWCLFIFKGSEFAETRSHIREVWLMAAVDSLEVAIAADASAAVKEINKLNYSLDSLRKKLNFNIGSLGLKSVSSEIKNFTSAVKPLQRMGKINLSEIAKEFSEISKIDGQKLAEASNGMKTLSVAAGTLNSVTFDNKNITSLLNSVTRLSKVKIADNKQFEELGKSLKGMVDNLAGAKDVSKTTSSVVSSIARLASAGSKAGEASKALPVLKTNLKGLINTLARVPEVTAGTNELVSGIAKLASAGNRTKQTADNLGYLSKELKNFIQSLRGAPVVSASTVKLVSAIAQLSSAGKSFNGFGSSAKNAFSGTASALNRLGNAVKNQTNHLNTMSKAMAGLKDATVKTFGGIKSFTSQIIGAMGVSLGLYGAVQGIKNAIDFSSSLTEVQNVVDTTFGDMAYKVEDFAKTSIEQLGMSELSVKQYASRFQSMGTAMGINSRLISDANSRLAKLTNGYIAASGSMADVSLNLTKLTADMASFYDAEQKAVAEDLSAIYTGEGERLRKYGLDLTVATLEEWAHKQGIDAKMQSMSQAEKTMLRYQYVLAQTGASHGDFAKTMNSWHNQIIILQEGLRELAGVIGGVFINAFKPMVKALNSAMGHIIAFAKTISNALGHIFGWTYEEGGGITDDFAGGIEGAGDLADGMDGVADATDDATEAQKKFNKQLSKFDELNNYTTSKSGKDKDKDDGGGASLDDLAGLGGAAAGKWVESDSILKKFKSDIDSLYELGEYIGNALTKAMESIPWNNVYEKARNFGSGLASFLNGLFTGEKGKKLFEATGETISGALNTMLHTALSFSETFEWDEFGANLAAGLKSFFKTFDWDLGVKTFNTLANGILDSVIGALDEISISDLKKVAEKIAELIGKADVSGISFKVGKIANKLVQDFYTLVSNKDTWKNLGKQIANGINNFFKGMGQVDPETGLNGWEALGKSISDTILGFGDMIITALDGVHWQEVGEAIATFIENIKWKDVIWELGEVVKSFAEALKETLTGAGVPEPLSNLVVNVGIGGWIIKKLSKTKLIGGILSKIGDKFSVPFKRVGAVIKEWLANKKDMAVSGLKSKISKAVGKITTTLKNVGAKVKSWIADNVNKNGLISKITKKIGKVSTSLKKVAVTVKDWFVNALTSITDKIKDMMPSKVDTGKKVELGANWKPIGLESAINTAIKGFGSFGISLLVTDIITGGDAWKGFLGDTSKVFSNYEKTHGNYSDEDIKKIEEIENSSLIKDFINAVGKFFNGDKKETNIKVNADTTELDKAITDNKETTVKYKANTKELEEANKMADADHENTTTYETDTKELDKAIAKALEDLENTTLFGTNLSELDKAIAKATKDRNNETTFNTKAKSLKEKIEEAEADHENTTKFYADPAVAFTQATKNWKAFKNNKTISTNVKFTASGDISKLNSIIDNVLIPSEKKFKITLDVATKGMGSAAVTNMPWNKHAKGSEGLSADEIGVVNDQKGSIFKELIIPPHGKPFIPDGRNVILPMEKGTRVIPAGKTKRLIENLPHFANGTEDFNGDKKPKGLSDIADGVSQAINDTTNKISEVKRQLEETQSLANDLGANASNATQNTFTSSRIQDTSSSIAEAFAKIPEKTSQFVQTSAETTVSRLEDIFKKTGFGVKRYATGGFPEDGWFRASRGEIMGRFDNGQSVVANNQQITEGISLAVQAGNQESNMLMRQEINLLQRQNDLLMGILQKETGISRDDVFNAVRESDAMFYKRNHRGAFEH